MKKNLFFTLFLLVLAFVLPTDLDAQYYGKKKKKKKKPTTEKSEKPAATSTVWKEKIWYGTGAEFPIFGGSNSIRYFSVGLSPLAGYKIIPNVSVGPRLTLNYLYIKAFQPEAAISSNIDYGMGAFARAKFFRQFFGHVEYRHNWIKNPLSSGGYFEVDPVTNRILTVPSETDNFFVGLGYSSGMSKWAYEIVVLYDTMLPVDSYALPFSFQAGFSYNF